MSFLPKLDRSLLHFSAIESRPAVLGELERCLMQPLQDLLARPKKEVRGSLVHLGFELINQCEDQQLNSPDQVRPSLESQQQGLEACAQAIEALHTGSLIIDDIEDQSEWRRGGPTLHLKYGMPTALNAGNWLYFFAFEKIRKSGLSSEIRLQLYELIEEVLLEAHTGQALDVGTDISRQPADAIPALCASSLELKSGALMALALQMGAVIAMASKDQLQTIKKFGVEFGVSLQMFDDLGNVRVDRPTRKHLEDLMLRRPSFVWWVLAENFTAELPTFTNALDTLPDPELLKNFLQRVPLLETGFSRALAFQQRSLRELQTELKPALPALQKLEAVAERVAHAYS